MLGENLFFSTAFMIHLFRQSTRLAAEVTQAGDEGPAPAAEASDCAPHPGDSCTGALATSSFTSTVKSQEQVFHTSSIPTPDAGVELDFLMPRRATAHTATAHTSVLHRSTALPSQHIPEVCNAASLVLGMLVLPVLQVHLLLLCLGHLLWLWLLLDVSHSALLWHIGV